MLYQEEVRGLRETTWRPFVGFDGSYYGWQRFRNLSISMMPIRDKGRQALGPKSLLSIAFLWFRGRHVRETPLSPGYVGVGSVLSPSQQAARPGGH